MKGENEENILTPPKKPRNAFIYYCMDMVAQMKENLPKNGSLRNKYFGEKWNSLDEGEKQIYFEKAENDVVRYDVETFLYNSSNNVQKPLNGYGEFYNDVFPAIQTEFPSGTLEEYDHIVCERWNALDKEEKLKYRLWSSKNMKKYYKQQRSRRACQIDDNVDSNVNNNCDASESDMLIYYPEVILEEDESAVLDFSTVKTEEEPDDKAVALNDDTSCKEVDSSIKNELLDSFAKQEATENLQSMDESNAPEVDMLGLDKNTLKRKLSPDETDNVEILLSKQIQMEDEEAKN